MIDLVNIPVYLQSCIQLALEHHCTDEGMYASMDFGLHLIGVVIHYMVIFVDRMIVMNEKKSILYKINHSHLVKLVYIILTFGISLET